MGRHAFEAQYQQNPLPEDGDYVRREYFPRVETPGLDSFRRVVISVDPAAKKGTRNDFTAVTVWGANAKVFHLLDAVKGRWTVTETCAHIVKLAKDHGAHLVIVEDTSTGTAILEMLNQSHPRISRLGTSPVEDKVTRLLRQLGKIESKMVTLPKDAPWVEEVLQEWCNFPNARHDDYVDSLVQFLEWTDGAGKIWLMGPIEIPIGLAPRQFLEESAERVDVPVGDQPLTGVQNLERQIDEGHEPFSGSGIRDDPNDAGRGAHPRQYGR